MVLPRVSAVQNLQDNTIPFARTMNSNCKAPLNAIKDDLTNIRNFSETTKTSDAGYAGGVGTYVGTLRLDQGLLSDSLYTLQRTSVPDAKYQTLLDECVKSLKGYQALLTSPQAIPVPSTVGPLLAPIAPLLGANAVKGSDGSITSVSALGLFTASVAVAASGAAPTGTAQTIVSQAMTTVINTKNDTLTKAGDQLVQDIKDGLNNNLSPFKVNVPVG
jgi:hypothetical protein